MSDLHTRANLYAGTLPGQAWAPRVEAIDGPQYPGLSQANESGYHIDDLAKVGVGPQLVRSSERELLTGPYAPLLQLDADTTEQNVHYVHSLTATDALNPLSDMPATRALVGNITKHIRGLAMVSPDFARSKDGNLTPHAALAGWLASTLTIDRMDTHEAEDLRDEADDYEAPDPLDSGVVAMLMLRGSRTVELRTTSSSAVSAGGITPKLFRALQPGSLLLMRAHGLVPELAGPAYRIPRLETGSHMALILRSRI